MPVAGGATKPAGSRGKVTASSDTRTNTIVVTGPTDDSQEHVIEHILTQLDNDPLVEQSFFVYNLKNAQALNLQTV